MELNTWALIWSAGPVVKCVMLILIFMSLYSWTLLFQKRSQFKKLNKSNERFVKSLQKAATLESQMSHINAFDATSGAAYIFKKALQEFHLHTNKSMAAQSQSFENVLRSIEQAQSDQTLFLQKKTNWLATIASSAPFIGLFGTVWGIMNSFMDIGIKGSSNLAVVAPGISEALIATALGLFAAIPASIFFNSLQNQIAESEHFLEQFSTYLFNRLKRQSSPEQ